MRQLVDRELDDRRFTVQGVFKFKQQILAPVGGFKVHLDKLCRLITEIQVDDIAYLPSRAFTNPRASVSACSCM